MALGGHPKFRNSQVEAYALRINEIGHNAARAWAIWIYGPALESLIRLAAQELALLMKREKQ